MTEEEVVDLTPPGPERVASRALVLAAVACRNSIERAAGNQDAEELRQEVLQWLEDVRLSDELEPEERALLATPLGGLSDRQRIDAGWRVEGLAVLAWALGRHELPAYDVQADGPDAGSSLGFLEDREETVLHAPRLRSREALTALADQMLALHWRLRQFSLDGAAIDFVQVAARAWVRMPLDGLRLVEGDLELRGVPLVRAPESLREEVRSIASERQQAANWLEGEHPLYSEVGCDT